MRAPCTPSLRATRRRATRRTRRCGCPEPGTLTTGAPGVVVAIVDSGVDPAHPDLAGAVRAGYDFVDRDADTSEPAGGGHGTAVAGVAAARANNGVGGVGSCFGCDVMPLRVLGPGGFAFNTDTAAAIDYAVDHGAAVVNASIYGERSPERLRAAVERARAAGVLVVAAAGNESSTTPQFPAAFPDALSVAATSADGTLASFSSRGPWVKLAAPACAPVTVLGGTTTVACGTSVSSPLVAGIVALMRRRRRSRAPTRSRKRSHARLARSRERRFGLVDAAAALDSLGRPGPRLRPEIVGSPVAGEPLEAFSGVWSGAGLAVSYRWQRCRAACVPVAGATGARLTPTAADAGARFRVEASAPGVETALSDHSGQVEVRPRLSRAPVDPRAGARRVTPRGANGPLGGNLAPAHEAMASLRPILRGRRLQGHLPRPRPRSRSPPRARGRGREPARRRDGSEPIDRSRSIRIAP